MCRGKRNYVEAPQNCRISVSVWCKNPRKISHDHFKNTFQVFLQFFSTNVLFLIGDLYNTMTHTHLVGWRRAVENSCVLCDLYSKIFRENKTCKHSKSLFLFVLHLYCISTNTSVTIIYCLFSIFSPLEDLTKVHFQVFGNLPRNLFITFKVFDQTQQFILPLFNTSTCSDDSSWSEPRPVNHWRILFKYNHLFFLACYLLLTFSKSQNIEGNTQKNN